MAGRRNRWGWQLGLTTAVTAMLAGYAFGTPPVAEDQVQASVMRPVAEETLVRETEEEARLYAQEVGQPVEILSMRDERTSVFADPEGSLIAEQNTEPVRVVRDGEWVPVNADLQPNAEGNFVPAAATFGLELSKGGDGPLLTAERAGQTMTLDWPGELPPVTIDGDQAKYEEVLPGVDLVVNVTPDSFSHVVVIKTPEAAEDPRVAELEFGLETDGLTVSEDADGVIAAVDDASGGEVFEAPSPTMWESPEAQPVAAARQALPEADVAALAETADETAPATVTETPLEVEVTEDSITLLPDQEMLQDPETNYPVYVDPTYSTSRATAYTMVAKGYPNESYWKFKGKKHEGVGECPVSSGSCAGVGVKRLYYTIPTPYDGLDVISAKFKVTMVHSYDGSAKDVTLYRADKSIKASTTWNNQPSMVEKMGTASPTGVESGCERANQNVQFDVMNSINNINRDDLEQVTFGVRADDEADHTAWKRFCGNAILSVVYNRKPVVKPFNTCISGGSRPLVTAPRTMAVKVSDADDLVKPFSEYVTVQFDASYNNNGTWTPLMNWTTPRQLADPDKLVKADFTVTVPQNKVISWRARASNIIGGTTVWGAWSSSCEFLYDNTAPQPPDIDSAEFLPLDAPEKTGTCVRDNSDRGWAGLYSTFTFDSPGTDAVKYYYGFDEDPKYLLTPATSGGPVTIRYLAKQTGMRWINVYAVDAAGNRSGEATCEFGVSYRLPEAQWGLKEAATKTQLADAIPVIKNGQEDTTKPAGRFPLSKGAGATLAVPGPGCPTGEEACDIDTAVRFTGQANSYLTSGISQAIDTTQAYDVAKAYAVVDTSKTFSVAAWVKLADTTRDRVAVSQDGSGTPGFTLGYEAATKKWAFKIPAMDVTSLGEWKVLSTGDAVANKWTHLIGVFDTENRKIHLIVNGVSQSLTARQSFFTSRGSVQIGRARDRAGYRDMWQGDISDVVLYDRILVSDDIKKLSKVAVIRLGYWQLNSASSGKSPEVARQAAKELTLTGGAKVLAYDPNDWENPTQLVGSGYLSLNGSNGAAYTAGSIVPGERSFTASVRVKVSANSCPKSTTALSQVAESNSLFRLGCAKVGNDYRWQLTGPGASPVKVSGRYFKPDNSAAFGQHLAVVYDSSARELRLYVNGQSTSEMVIKVADTQTFPAGGALQIGRAFVAGKFGEYFGGLVDEVRVYEGALEQPGVQQISQTEEFPKF
ncbi:LamG-like jellyroll fold domain-containing protein [Actinoplanes sp. OR16]|uniref:LamG-like jellyroll fold domain-containing protein n=1 Tax=Actinoplanes sp. OR16 TaxID=946334 RepID=UPI000FDB7CF3|nr:LamG-like jellyroll fold domain-containing protein [Actinoplanes sp. OR16]